ncbi:uncharacterized protein LOC144149175 [Haemaphysalis longicornis]
MGTMTASLGAVLVLATVLALADANGKGGASKPAAVKVVHQGPKHAAPKPGPVLIPVRPPAPRQPHYDFWRPWYTNSVPHQHHHGHARKENPKPPQHKAPQPHPHVYPQRPQQNWLRWPTNTGSFEWGRGDHKATDGYVPEGKPVAYDTVIKEEKKVVIQEEPKVVVKEVPKVVVKEEPKVIVQEVPKVVVKEEPKVIVQEVPKIKKHKVLVSEPSHHEGCLSKHLKKMHKQFKKTNKKFKDHHKHHKPSKAIVFFRTQTPYYYYTQVPRYHNNNGYYYGNNGYY